MITKTVTAGFKMGVHSRPAALIVKKAREYPETSIRFSHMGKESIGTSLIGILTLGIREDSPFEIHVDGGDEEKVLSDFLDFFHQTASKEV